jgi:hypothetical protein
VLLLDAVLLDPVRPDAVLPDAAAVAAELLVLPDELHAAAAPAASAAARMTAGTVLPRRTSVNLADTMNPPVPHGDTQC